MLVIDVLTIRLLAIAFFALNSSVLVCAQGEELHAGAIAEILALTIYNLIFGFFITENG